jgi:HAMP domain-containing protein
MRLRTQLTLVVTAVVALIVALAGLVIVVRIDHRDRADLDRILATRADQVRATAVRSGVLPSDGSYAVRLLVDGQVKTQSGSTVPFPVPVEDGYATLSADGGDWRSLTETLVSGARMQVLISLRDLKEQHDDNVLVVDLLVVLAALLTAAGVWFATGLVLRPFQRLLVAARSLDPVDPGARLPEVTSPREVAELTRMLNGMLDRFRLARPAAPPRVGPDPLMIDTAPMPVVQKPPRVELPKPVEQPVAKPVVPKEPEPVMPKEPEPVVEKAPEPPRPDPSEVLSEPLAGLGANLDTLLDNPQLSSTQRHLILAAMLEDHRRMVATLAELQSATREN